MALYVASHYKNSPNDLQLMADAPAHHLFVLLGTFLFLNFVATFTFYWHLKGSFLTHVQVLLMSHKISSQIFYALYRLVKTYVLCPSRTNIFNI